MALRPLALATVLAASFASFASAQEPSRDDLVQARLFTGSRRLPPGHALLAVTFDVAPDWHIYWQNPGDAGMPTSVVLHLPEGWTQGSLSWPAPERHVDPAGPVVSYVFTGSVTLFLDIEVPAGAAPGPARITGRADWLVCKDGCLVGGADLTLDVTVVAKGTPAEELTHDTVLIMEARKHLVRRAPASLRSTWSGSELTLEVPGATGLTFAPLEPADAQDMARRGEADGPRLILAWPLASVRGKKVTGVLEVRRGSEREAVSVTVDGPP